MTRKLTDPTKTRGQPGRPVRSAKSDEVALPEPASAGDASALPLDPFEGPDLRLGRACRALLDRDEEITLRSAAREAGMAHTTLSRDPVRRGQLTACATLQQGARRVAASHRRRAEKESDLDLARARERIALLEQQVGLLVASHRAMILAVANIGGISAWRRLWPDWTRVRAELEAADALPAQAPLSIERDGQ